MKRFLKLFLVVLLISVVAISVIGCGKKEENTNNAATENNTKAENNGTAETTATSSKTYNALSKLNGDYVMSLEGEMEAGVVMSITIAFKGDNMYADVKSDGEHATVVYKDGITYLIAHDEKMYMVQEGKDEDTFGDLIFFSEDDLNNIKDEKYKTGKETIEGTEYDYEEYTDSETNEVERFYFSGNELRYIKSIDENGNEQLMKINTLSSEVDDSLFEIPADYQKVEA